MSGSLQYFFTIHVSCYAAHMAFDYLISIFEIYLETLS